MVCLTQNTDLCARCFHRGRHSHHKFVFRGRRSERWMPAMRQSEVASEWCRALATPLLFLSMLPLSPVPMLPSSQIAFPLSSRIYR